MIHKLRITSRLGPHVRGTLFTAPGPDRTFAMNGELIFAPEELKSFVAASPGLVVEDRTNHEPNHCPTHPA